MSARRLRETVLPYGLWTCADGREVLFTRMYKPLCQRISGEVSDANTAEWVKYQKQEWFYDDGDVGRRGLRGRLEVILKTFQAGEDVRQYLKSEGGPWKLA